MLTRSNDRAPANRKWDSAIVYLLAVSRCYSTFHPIVSPLSLKFMVVEHAGLMVHLKEEAKEEKATYRINCVEITKARFSKGYISPRNSQFSMYFHGDKLIQGYQIRHKQSVASLVSQMVIKWRDKPLSVIPAEQCLNFLMVCNYIKRDIRKKVEAKDNLFIGTAIENQAFGWLASVLALRKSEIIRHKPAAPLVVEIPKNY